jgi:hypothetical protein
LELSLYKLKIQSFDEDKPMSILVDPGLYARALQEAEDGLPEAERALPPEQRKAHAQKLLDDACQSVVGCSHKGVTSSFLLSKFVTAAHVSARTALSLTLNLMVHNPPPLCGMPGWPSNVRRETRTLAELRAAQPGHHPNADGPAVSVSTEEALLLHNSGATVRVSGFRCGEDRAYQSYFFEGKTYIWLAGYGSGSFGDDYPIGGAVEPRLRESVAALKGAD